METFIPLQFVSTFEYSIYLAACLLNFMAALWLASASVHMRESDWWLMRTSITVIGLAYAIITVSLFAPPQYPPPESVVDPGFSSLIFKSIFASDATTIHVFWMWVAPILGVMMLLKFAGMAIPDTVMRLVTYITAIIAAWGTYIVFMEQNAFGELATYFGFYAANLAAATWMIGNSLKTTDRPPMKRLGYLGVSVIYFGLVVTAAGTMQMILESPY